MSAVEDVTLVPPLSRHRLHDAATAALRVLAMDAVENARSGHPGMPMGMAEIASVLWRGYLRHNPANPNWPNRDRFVLSNGHGSMLLYALLHLTGSANPDAVIIATGSEVQLAMGAARRLAEDRIAARVVSMPCVEAFERQPMRWRESVIPHGVPVFTVEAGATRGWWKYAGHGGAVIGIDRFGESAPDRDLWTYFELTVDRVARTVRELIMA